MKIYFIKDQKAYTDKFGKKSKSDYVLNINKVMREKLDADFIVPNKTQAFLLNYEIRKLIDKAINIKNRKYTTLVYLNVNLNQTLVLNAIEFLKATYPTIEFESNVLDSDEEYDSMDGVTIIKR